MSENERLPSPINLKHRIIGAVILVSLAVIFLPMILSEREPPSELKAISEIPGKGSAPDVAPAPEALPPSTFEHALPVPVPETTPAPATKPAAPAPAKAPASSARPAKGWVVQVGIFANAANAARLGDKLKAQGHEVMLENITQNNEKRVRLRVGPFADKGAAQQAQTKIRQDAGVSGAVVSYP